MSNPFARPDEAKEISEVNVVPLADVSLVLLIILLVLSPMITQSALQVKTAARSAPEPSAPPVEELWGAPELVLVVGLTPGGFSLGDRSFPDAAALGRFLQAELPRRADRKVFLSPYLDAAHGRVVEAIETIRSAGAESVALVQIAEDSHGLQPPATTP